jgi:tRNA (guanosine-2'-O-)-methyltransferase
LIKAAFFISSCTETKNMKELIHYLEGFVNQQRLEMFRKIIAFRTRYITVVLEDIFQPQNASAVMRSCDSFGIQDIHIIENTNRYRINPRVTHGCDKWLTINRYNEHNNNTACAIKALKKQKYRIIATTPEKTNKEFFNIDLHKGKIAVFIGTELTGLSEHAINNADEKITIPMYGFSESLNLSVSAALILWNMTSKLRDSDINWKLCQKESDVILLEWLRKSINKCSSIEKYFNERIREKKNNNIDNQYVY